METMETYVVVTTDKDRRGIFGGILESYDPTTQIAILRDARMAVYFSAATHGVNGLAANGPADGSRISPPVPRQELNGVTTVMNATDRARTEWEKGKWA